MNLDKFNFDFSDFDINDIDFENMGSWPKAAKVAMAAIVSIAVGIGSYMFLVSSEVEALENAELQEIQLKNNYRIKYGAAVNLDSYKKQMVDMEEKFSLLLKRLPTSHETPGLLDDKYQTQVGLPLTCQNYFEPIL